MSGAADALEPWRDPHHDGSPLYTPEGSRALGSTVRLRVRVPHHEDGHPAAEHVVLRSVRDGEPSVVEATCVSTDEAGAWWETGVPESLSGRESYDEAKQDQLRWL